MTVEERVQLCWPEVDSIPPSSMGSLRRNIAKQIRAAVVEERKACANAVLEHESMSPYAQEYSLYDIATLIRARGKEGE